MNRKVGFFPYETMNFKAAQAYLDRKANQGWVLKNIYLGCIAWFEESENRSHFVDLNIVKTPDFLDPGERDEDYIQLCADAGWELVRQLRGMLIFRSAEGASPSPIQSDKELEWERFREKFVRRQVKNTLIALFILAMTLIFTGALPLRRALSPMAASNGALLYWLVLVMGCLVCLFGFLHDGLYLLKCKRSGTVALPGRAAALLDTFSRLWLPLLILAWCVTMTESFEGNKFVDLSWEPFHQTRTATVEACQAYPVVMGCDLGLGSGSSDSRYLTGRRSIAAQLLDYSELIPDEEGLCRITTQRYECRWEWLARWVFAQRARETQNGAFLWGRLEWTAAEVPGFDQFLATPDGGYLLLRQGRIVALVGMEHQQLTAPQNLSVIARRLTLEG